ncbi:2'-5' RNA ligase [Methanocaldococcus villosus KIN24-T80]|uniref:RNA 2',3'-cyclic phosphodiesterase n=1 Tax=Methanocaldococcus villosus KIN24-T80 TaxID=1069083 RepID=N6VPE6_9EURY|nr:RNA 2',3'-cyclic phosphodiesterase [Methanocaldococcus villosus]ENN95755.1 2'-5' RNA ligase [Methanocaldococcus villosus KIN24-T80]
MRLFLAIDIPKDIKNKIYEFQKSFKIKGIKLVEKENLHITVKFLGEVDENLLNKILDLDLSIEPIRIKLKNLGVFPNENFIRVIWVGVEGDKIIDLFKDIDKKLSTLGFKKENNYIPHLTIGRVKFIENKKLLKDRIREFKNVEFGSFTAEKIKLYKSTLTREGPIYEIIKEW